MGRRDVIAILAAVAAGIRPWRPARAQTGIRRVGVVYRGGPFEPAIETLRDGLRAAGLEEGRHFTLLVRDSKGGDAAAAEAAARDLERDDKVDIIVAITSTVARAAKQATEKVPIVFAIGADAVAAGLVESIAAPGHTKHSDRWVRSGDRSGGGRLRAQFREARRQRHRDLPRPTRAGRQVAAIHQAGGADR